MRGDGEDGEDGDMVEIGTDATQEILSGSESGNDDQKVDTEETSGGKSVAKKRTRKASMVTIRETTGEKATAKKRSCKNPVKNKAIIGRSKVVKIKATWESVKAEVAAEAKAKE
ncbi:hypothetical protein DID88_008158 [Monilinia fructigena]|uniref:Uncharacterized protein n=1 Tax=Monilinia fructigena TaxID=38457 RepID=A0A395J6X4_9HELO|nr:hypothetical protein DID88_008158 [Monilinia fructigena]